MGERAQIHQRIRERLAKGQITPDQAQDMLTNPKIEPDYDPNHVSEKALERMTHSPEQANRFMNNDRQIRLALRNSQTNSERVQTKNKPHNRNANVASKKEKTSIKGFPLKRTFALMLVALVGVVAYQLGSFEQTPSSIQNEDTSSRQIVRPTDPLDGFSQCLSFRNRTNVNQLLEKTISSDTRLSKKDLNAMLSAVAKRIETNGPLKTGDYTIQYENAQTNFSLTPGCIQK